MLEFDVLYKDEEPENICVVRVKTSYWNDGNGLYQKKAITFLRRKSKGFNILEEDCSAIGTDQVMQHIENLGSVEDGIYRVQTINETRDWESGYVDGYDYFLVKYEDA